jgi:hypothetical protein
MPQLPIPIAATLGAVSTASYPFGLEPRVEHCDTGGYVASVACTSPAGSMLFDVGAWRPTRGWADRTAERLTRKIRRRLNCGLQPAGDVGAKVLVLHPDLPKRRISAFVGGRDR